MTEVDGGADDVRLTHVARHCGNERLVDLDLVDRQAVEVSQRRVPGAEIVDRQPYTRVFEARQDLQDALRLGHDHAFRDFEDELMRIRAGLPDQLVDLLWKRRIDQVAHRDVDRHRERPAGVVPAAPLAERRSQHPAGQRPDQPCLLGEGDELHRRDHAVAGVLPADQGLESLEPAGAQVDQRLIVEQ